MPFMINDLHPGFRGGRTVTESACPPPQVAEEREEQRSKMRRRQGAICCNMSPHSGPPSAVCFVAGGQARREDLICLSLSGNACAQLSFQYVYVIVSLC